MSEKLIELKVRQGQSFKLMPDFRLLIFLTQHKGSVELMRVAATIGASISAGNSQLEELHHFIALAGCP